MKLQLADIKKTKFYSFLPKEFAYLNDGQYLSFYYLYDDANSKIIDIKKINVASAITSLVYKGRPFSEDGSPYAIGGLASPFDTQHTFFYLFLKYYCEKDEQASKDLLDFFLKAKVTDLESVKEKMKYTTFSNSFEIVTRDNFCTALDRYLFCNPQITTSVLTIVDTIDSHYRRKMNGKSIFYNCIEKIVTGIPMPQGGLMPEKNGMFEYFYIGEKSELTKDDKQLQEAKDMFRNQFEISEIYAKTGWFFNAKDTKWRKLIDDSEAVLLGGVDLKSLKNKVIITDKSEFVGQNDNMLRLMGGVKGVNFDYAGIAEKFHNGWDVVLGDILQHPTLYKHYPKLYNTPIFFGISSKLKKDKDAYNFFYTDAGFLFIMGNPDEWDLKTVLLHEVQHRIQSIEGTSQGGSMDLANMIMAIGGENIKKYIFFRDKIVELFSAGATVSGKYSYQNYVKLNNELIQKRTENDYYKDINGVANSLISAYLYLSVNNKFASVQVTNFLGKECESILKDIDNILSQAENGKRKLFLNGYSGEEIESIFFSMYESLGGEIESRDVQHTSVFAPELKGYSLPLSSEYVEEKKITSIFKGMFSGVPQDIKGGCENIGDGKYIIHLFDSGSPEPILHELGHILYDLMKENISKTEMIELPGGPGNFGGYSEIFCELFLCYLLRQDINPRFNRSITEGRKLMEYTFMDASFDTIFKHKEDFDENDKELVNMLSYMKKLNDSLDRKPNPEPGSPLAILDELDVLDYEIKKGLGDLRDMLSETSDEEEGVFGVLEPVFKPEVLAVVEPKKEEVEPIIIDLTTKEGVLKASTIEGNTVYLPKGQLDRKLYADVAKALELIGGKWKGGKIMGFVFNEDPTELLAQISGGEKRNLKKEFQFFGTPDALSDELVQLANIQPTDKILEPSAGQGSIVKAIQRRVKNMVVDYCEFMPVNQIFMKKLPNVNMVGDDFLALPLSFKYDKILANPPFSKNQDVVHVQKMYEHLKPGGRLVSITSPHWKNSSNKKETEFRDWLTKVGATIKDIPAGTFKESGTSTATVILVIDKK